MATLKSVVIGPPPDCVQSPLVLASHYGVAARKRPESPKLTSRREGGPSELVGEAGDTAPGAAREAGIQRACLV